MVKRGLLALLLVLPACAGLSAERSIPPLWGRLEAGPWQAGFVDDSVVVGGRPAFVAGVWYPALPGSGEAMAYRAYVVANSYGGTDAAARLSDFAWRLSTWSGWTPHGVGALFPEGVAPERLEQMLRSETAASSEATAAPGRFPAVVLATGAVLSNPILGEYLASHGFLVVTYIDAGDRGQVNRAELAAQRRSDLAAVVDYVRDRSDFGGRLTLFGSGSGTVASVDVVAAGAGVDALIVQGGGIPSIASDLAGTIDVPMLDISLSDRPTDWQQRWDAVWRMFRSSPRLTMRLDGSHAELIAASRLAYPERAADQRVFDALLLAVRAFATDPDPESLRAAVRRSGLPEGRFELRAAAPER